MWLVGFLCVRVECGFWPSFIVVCGGVAHLIFFVCVPGGFIVSSVSVWGVSAHLFSGLV